MRMQTTIRLLICLFFIALATSIAHAQTPAITYQRYDADITIQPDGIFRVREIQQIRFDGEFHTAFAEIPTDLTTDIRNVQLYEGESPYSQGGTGANTFSSEPSGNAVYVSWEYAPTQPGDVRTFVLEYEVVGGLWVYPDETVLEWRAVPADRSGIVVENSVVTVTLPSAVTSDQLHYTAYGPTYQTATQPTALVFAANEPLPDGVQFQVQVGFPPGVVTAQRQPWQVQEDSARLDYRFQALNVDLVLQSDGDLLVDEAHHLAVDAGLLDQGFRQIPLHFLDAIDQIQLMEGEQAFTEGTSGCDYCLQVKQTARQPDWVRYDDDQRKVVTRDSQAGSVELNWQFPPLVRGEETTLHLRYRALGAVRHFADHQEIRWSAVFPEHKQTVESATVRLKLPETVARNQVKISGGTVQWQPDGSALLVAPSGFPPNRAWEIVVSLPVGATTGAIPQWQQMLENAANEAQQAEIGRARLKLGFGVAALLIFLLGLLGVYLLWFLRGRDQAQPAVATYLTEPPSTLSPAIVAYLLDEVASANGALASLFHLATLGLLRIRFDGIFVLKRMEEVSPVAGESIQTSSGEETILPNHLVTLFTALQPLLPLQKEVPLHQIYNQFQAALPKVYREMGEETTRFFDELPPQARHRWLERGQWLVLLSVGVALVLGWLYYGDMGWLAIAPALAASVAGIALMVASRWMPRRTAVGVEEKQRWLAFRNYLLNMSSFGNQSQAQRILDRYFAYAVALGVEKVVIEQANEIGGMLPSWSYTSDWEPDRGSVSSRNNFPNSQPSEPTAPNSPQSASGGLPPLNFPAKDGDAKSTTATPRPRPSLSGMSQQLTNTLSGASDNLASLLTMAVSNTDQGTPFATLWQGTQTVGKVSADVASTTLEILGEILENSSSGDGGGGYSSSGSSRSSWSSSRSRSSSSSNSGRSSSSRRSGGGGKRGFG